MGIYYDSSTSFKGSVPKDEEANVEQTVAKLAKEVVLRVNSNYAFNSPLTIENMEIKYCPSKFDPTSDLHDIQDDKLITLVTPKPNSGFAGNTLGHGAGKSAVPLFGLSHFYAHE